MKRKLPALRTSGLNKCDDTEKWKKFLRKALYCSTRSTKHSPRWATDFCWVSVKKCPYCKVVDRYRPGFSDNLLSELGGGEGWTLIPTVQSCLSFLHLCAMPTWLTAHSIHDILQKKIYYSGGGMLMIHSGIPTDDQEFSRNTFKQVRQFDRICLLDYWSLIFLHDLWST